MVVADDELCPHARDGNGEVADLTQFSDGSQVLKDIFLIEVDVPGAQELLNLLAGDAAGLGVDYHVQRIPILFHLFTSP
jgi:hypothetical protein